MSNNDNIQVQFWQLIKIVAVIIKTMMGNILMANARSLKESNINGNLNYKSVVI